MQHQLCVCVYNNEPDSAETLAEAFGTLSNVQVVHTVSQWNELRSALQGAPVHVVAINLDEDVDFGLNVAQRLIQIHPELGVVGISRRTDPTTIISAMRAGCSQFVCAPIDANDLARALKRACQTHLGGVSQRSRRICVVASTGGAGATTIACNLTIELAQLTQKRTGLVDLNLEFGDVACALDCEPKYSLSDLCSGGSTIDTAMLETAIHDLPCDVSILARPENVDDARAVTPEGVEQTLSAMSQMYPHVVVDLPRSFSFLSAAALHGTDMVLIVAQLNVSSIRNATRVYNWLMEMGAEASSVEIVLNRCKAEFERITPEDVEKHLARPVFAMIPNDYRRVMEAREFGQPIFTEAPSSAARLAIRDMAKKIAVIRSGDEGGQPKKKGMFGRLLGKT